MMTLDEKELVRAHGDKLLRALRDIDDAVNHWRKTQGRKREAAVFGVVREALRACELLNELGLK